MRNLFKIYKKLVSKFLASLFRKRVNWKKKVTKVGKSLYLLLLLPIDLIGHLLTFWKSNAELEDPDKILIIKSDQYGDVLFSTFIVPLIKDKHPQAEIHYLIDPKTEVLLKENPNIEKLYYWKDPLLFFILGREEKQEEKGFFGLLKQDYETLRKTRKESYDLVVNTRALVPSSNLPFKLMGEVLSAFDASEQSFLADYCADYDFHGEEWKNYLNLLEPLSIKKEEFSPQFYNLDPEGLKEKFPSRKEKLITIAPISFDEERLWEKEKWQRVVKQLRKRKYQVVLTGLPSQREYLEQIAGPFEEAKVLTNLTIPQLGSLINNSEALLCIDAFATHLGIALDIPTICLVNPDAYYLPGFSEPKRFIEAKSMVPLIDSITILPLESNAEHLIKELDK